MVVICNSVQSCVHKQLAQKRPEFGMPYSSSSSFLTSFKSFEKTSSESEERPPDECKVNKRVAWL